ncbi:putative F-box/FBD/LRR-repeat protein At1g78760 isoform X2 [Corylus avellana]|uniref:putative F-box/FBD/LRR-repeat protein At1g78760 isoform X2 n=1 Tax=Corylus avellana TaxID=13451 RepID=UPI00286A6D41|nr:putative F-box/FBD/LRR-repeat protein At1g78760 isoform X2 [Corylus avellana]
MLLRRVYFLKDGNSSGLVIPILILENIWLSWITAAVRCNVQILSIHIRDLRGQFSLPRCVFTCETLTSLVLAMPCILKIPPIICFSNLKVLSIKNVTFSDDYTTQQLFSGLQVLEVLYLMECRWGCLKVLKISAPKLHSLTITEANMGKRNEEYCEGLSDCDDHRDFEGCRITIFGANIKCFFYMGEFFNEYRFYNSFSLERAKIDVTQSSDSYCDKRRRQVAYRMLKVLRGLANVKDLRLYQFADGVLTYAPELLPTMPIFKNLKYLELEWGDINSKALLKILQNSPNLEKLKFSEIDECFDYDKDDILLDPMPPCFLSSLEDIEVGNYDGLETELAAVKILLKNAIALDEMVITFKEYNAGNFEMQEKLYKQLIDFPIGSQNCKIILKLAFLEHVLFRKAFNSCFF